MRNNDPTEWDRDDWDDFHRRQKMGGKGDPTEWSSRVTENPMPRMTKEEYEKLYGEDKR